MNLSAYDKFPFEEFVKDKKLEVTDLKSWLDYETGRRLGTTVTVSIAEDNSEYPTSAVGEVKDNYRQVFSVKVRKDNIAVKRDDVVRFIGVEAKIIGDYRNQLSVKADDVVVVDAKTNEVKK